MTLRGLSSSGEAATSGHRQQCQDCHRFGIGQRQSLKQIVKNGGVFSWWQQWRNIQTR